MESVHNEVPTEQPYVDHVVCCLAQKPIQLSGLKIILSAVQKQLFVNKERRRRLRNAM